MNNIPNITAVASAIVLIANTFFGTVLVTENVQGIIEAVVVLVLAGSSVWSWFHTRKLIAENVALSKTISLGKAYVSKTKKGLKSKKRTK